MLARGSGQIVNLTSVAARLSWPGAVAYSAARAAMEGFTNALRADLYGSEIGVTLAIFGTVESPYWQHNPGSPRARPQERPRDTRSVHAGGRLLDRHGDREALADGYRPRVVSRAVPDERTVSKPGRRVDGQGSARGKGRAPGDEPSVTPKEPSANIHADRPGAQQDGHTTTQRGNGRGAVHHYRDTAMHQFLPTAAGGINLALDLRVIRRTRAPLLTSTARTPSAVTTKSSSTDRGRRAVQTRSVRTMSA